MTDGIAALEGFDYQTMVSLELMLDHFDAHGTRARARPEGVDDLDLVYTTELGATHRALIQIKKPRQDADGLRAPSPWSLSEALDELLNARWGELQAEGTQLRWVLGDAAGEDFLALAGSGTATAVWAARRAAAEWLVRSSRDPAKTLGWESPFRAGTFPDGSIDDARRRWSDSFRKRANRAKLRASSIASWTTAIEAMQLALNEAMPRVNVDPSYAEASALRDRLTLRLASRFGLDPMDVRNIVYRNMRGYVDDIARARGLWIELPNLEQEIQHVWPRRLAVVQPPPLPRPHLQRRGWVTELSTRFGAIVGPSGSGKTTTATELYEHLRTLEPTTPVLYGEVRSDTAFENVLEGVVHSVGRSGEKGPYELLPSIRAGSEEALLRMADALEACARPVAILLDLVDGVPSSTFIRHAARFAQRLPSAPKTRFWIFGQEDALAELSDTERSVRGLGHVPARGLDWHAFYDLAALHGLSDRSELYMVYDALASGRATGVPPRVADGVLRLGNAKAALEAARSQDVLLAADTARFRRLHADEQAALAAVACFAHPFTLDDAESAFPALAIRAGIRAGIRVGLLQPRGDGRAEFHETVRRNVLAQQAAAVLTMHHTRLADVYAASGNHVLESHHADEAKLVERARNAGRAAFMDPSTADRVGARAVSRGWVTGREVLALLRTSPRAPYGWWRALRDDIDNETAESLLDWWRTSLTESGAHQVLWSAARALVHGRPDLLPRLLDLAATAAPVRGDYYGASALGVALRDAAVDEAVILERFERAGELERRALVGVLSSCGRPRSLARWLAHTAETGEASDDVRRKKDLSNAHIDALVDALPDGNASELLVTRDWGFGAATPFLWANRDAIGSGASRLLDDAHLAPRRARVALRLLGVAGHDDLAERARPWSRRSGEAQSVALTVPLLVDAAKWREELASIALDASMNVSLRTASFGMYVQSGDDGEALLSRIVSVTPILDRGCRLAAALSFAVRPSLFALEMIVDELAREMTDGMRRVFGISLHAAVQFADGPHAATVADRLLPLLDIAAVEVRASVLHVLSMLRDPRALQPCAALAVAEAGTPIGTLAAVAAAASRPTSLSIVREALEANPSCRWLTPVLADRLDEPGLSARLVADALDTSRSWMERRRALLALERHPAPELGRVVELVLAERPLLATLDTMDGELSETIARLMQEDAAFFAELWVRGRAKFVDILGTAVAKDAAPAVEPLLQVVWDAVEAAGSRGERGSAAIAGTLEAIQRAHVQAEAIYVARAIGRADLLERVIATSDGSWLVFRALVERVKLDPRTVADAQRWLDLLDHGPRGTDPSLHHRARNVVEPWLSPGPHRPGRAPPAESPAVALAADDLHRLLDNQQAPPPRHNRIAEMDDRSLDALIARLDPKSDSVVEHLDVPEAERVALTNGGVTIAGGTTRSSGRPGERPRMRAMLVARFPDRTPDAWLDPSRQGHEFLPALVDALADNGEPEQALHVFERLPGRGTELIRARTNLYRLGSIADEALVGWLSRVAGTGGEAEVEAVASFARQADVEAIIPLLENIMRRIAGQFTKKGKFISGDLDNMWRRALTDVLLARRLRDVPGASAWLVAMATKARDPLTRRSIVEAMAAFPSTWSVVEAEGMRDFESAHYREPHHRKTERIARALFAGRVPVR